MKPVTIKQLIEGVIALWSDPNKVMTTQERAFDEYGNVVEYFDERAYAFNIEGALLRVQFELQGKDVYEAMGGVFLIPVAMEVLDYTMAHALGYVASRGRFVTFCKNTAHPNIQVLLHSALRLLDKNMIYGLTRPVWQAEAAHRTLCGCAAQATA